jgi:G:T-mismatch repair DNA endonuclease (very short patch repair protein)
MPHGHTDAAKCKNKKSSPTFFGKTAKALWEDFKRRLIHFERRYPDYKTFILWECEFDAKLNRTKATQQQSRMETFSIIVKDLVKD